MREEYLMTGSFGLDNDNWQPVFYDEDLPTDWRASYYSTLLRSVYLSPGEWHKAVAEEWLDEVDSDFHFVLQLSTMQDYLDLCDAGEVFSDQISAVVLNYADVAKDADEQAFSYSEITNIKSKFHVCLDGGQEEPATSGLDEVCQQLDVSCVWYPSVTATPLNDGDFLLSLISDESLPEQREIVTKIDQWMTLGRRAGLFNINKENAPVKAQETRVLAELMGV